MSETASATKRCPGFAGIAQPPHDAPANLETFGSNKGNADGLTTRCRSCGNAYGAAWSARARAIRKAETIEDESERASAIDQAKAIDVNGYAQLLADRDVRKLDDAPEPAEPEPLATTADAQVATSETPVPPDLASRPGWGSSKIAGVLYAIPTDANEVGTAEGQAALKLANDARKAQAAQSKRDQRARAKEAAAQ